VSDQDQVDVDRALRDYAARWRQAQPGPAPIDLGRVTRPGPPRWLPVAAVAAAVAALSAGVFLAPDRTGGGHVTPPPPPATRTPERNPDAVIPWQPLPPVNATFPSTTVPPSPDPAPARGLPPCRASQLTATVERGAAAGTLYDGVNLRAASGAACRLEGRPQVTALGPHGEITIPVQALETGADYPGPVRVAGGAPAVIMLQVLSGDCRKNRDATALRLRLPDRGGVIDLKDGWPMCSKPAFPIGIGTFQPETWVPGKVGTIFATLTAEIPQNSIHVDPSGRVKYTLVLTVDGDDGVPLAPCPDYVTGVYLPTGREEETHALNCTGVPFRDAAGRPYLPAHSTVRFAMEAPFSTLSGGGGKLYWQLKTVDSLAAGGGVVV